jgi:hypothetical protein
MFDFSDFQILMDAIAVVLKGELESPKIVAIPIGLKTDDLIAGCVFLINLDRAHDPQIAQHFKSLMQRLLELDGRTEEPEQIALMQAAIAACKSLDEVEIKIL